MARSKVTPGGPRKGGRLTRWLLGLLMLALLATLWVAWRSGVWLSEPRTVPPPPGAAVTELVARGAYLAVAGNCASCHTARGGPPWAGGRAIATPFGTVYAGNLTPDENTGLGRWTAEDFWRALHHGRSRDGRFLTPVFPYPQYTRITRADADALHAYLRSLPAVQQANRPHDLRFPYNSQAALAVWRALYFSPQSFQPEATRSAEWNRGAYLVEGLGHCAACHAGRNALGATLEAQGLGGGHIPMQGWYAPSLAAPEEAGVARWPQDEVLRLLQTGTSAQGSVLGPMAEVVLNSTQHLSVADLRAMATYLQALPVQSLPRGRAEPVPPALMSRGESLYQLQCAGCHGKSGEGAPDAYPPLAGNRALGMASAANVIRVVLGGGYAPATAGNPRPYGMPPFAHTLSDEDVAAVVSYLRQTWGGGAGAVSPLDVQRLR